MAANLCYEGKRRGVNLGSGAPNHEILAEAVREFGLTGEPPHKFYRLMHKKRSLDLSMTLSQSGVPANAEVDVVAVSESTSKQVVKVALNVLSTSGSTTGSKRLVKANIPSDSSLLDMLLAFSADHPSDLAAASVPNGSLLYVRQTFQGDALATTTLAAIGLSSGSVLLSFTPSSDTTASEGTGSNAMEVDPSDLDSSSDSISVSALTATAVSGTAAAVTTAPASSPAAASKAVTFAAGTSQGDTAVSVEEEIATLEAQKATAVAIEDYGEASRLKAEIEALRAKATACTKAAAIVGPPSSLPSSAAATTATATPPPAVVPSKSAATAQSSSSSSSLSSAEPSSTAITCEEAAEEVCGYGGLDNQAPITCLVTVLKYLANVLKAPYDDRPRQIKMANSAFVSRVGSVQGGVECLMAVGFVKEVRGEPHVIALNELACTFLVLTRSASSRATPQASSSSSSSWSGGASNQPDDDAAVRAGFDVYRRAAMQRLGASASLLPALPPPALAAATFNPYAASFASTSGAPRLHAHQPSSTDRRLSELTAARDAILASASVPERELRIYPAHINPPSSASWSLSSTTSSAEEQPTLSSTNPEEASDSRLLAQALAAKMAKTKESEKTPFRTKAMREVADLEAKVVHTSTLLKIVLPDRSCATALFSAKESVNDVEGLVKSLLLEDNSSSGSSSFELFTTPPRQVLKAGSPRTLGELQLVPAAVLYVAWTSQPPPVGEYLSSAAVAMRAETEALAAQGGGGSGALHLLAQRATPFPTGHRLSAPPATHTSTSSSSLDASGGGGGERNESTGSDQGRAKLASGKKPAWMKLK